MLRIFLKKPYCYFWEKKILLLRRVTNAKCLPPPFFLLSHFLIILFSSMNQNLAPLCADYVGLCRETVLALSVTEETHLPVKLFLLALEHRCHFNQKHFCRTRAVLNKENPIPIPIIPFFFFCKISLNGLKKYVTKALPQLNSLLKQALH